MAKIKNSLFIVMYIFFIVVPLIPFKIKFLFFPLSPDFIIGGVAIVIGIIYMILAYKKDKSKFRIYQNKNLRILNIFIFLFASLSLISILWAVNKTAVISEWMRFIEYVLLFNILLIAADSDFIDRGLKLIFIAFILAAIEGAVEYIFKLSPYPSKALPFGRGEINATFVNPNYWGAAVNLVIYVPIVLLLERSKGRKSFKVLALLLFLFNLIFSFTRGAWLGFAVGLVVVGVIRFRKTIFAIPVAAAALWILPFTRARFVSIFSLTAWTNHERLTLWKTGYYMFRDHFWLGVGNGNYIYRYYEYIKKYPELYLYRTEYSIHNSYIKMFAELGIFGGIIFTLMYIFIFYLAFKAYRKAKGSTKYYLLAFLGFGGAYLFQNFFNDLIFIPQLNVFVWIILAMLLKKVLLEKREA